MHNFWISFVHCNFGSRGLQTHHVGQHDGVAEAQEGAQHAEFGGAHRVVVPVARLCLGDLRAEAKARRHHKIL